jgi:hypothetical protein
MSNNTKAAVPTNEELSDLFRAAYAAGDTKEKAAIRTMVKAAMMGHVEDLNGPDAKDAKTLLEGLVTVTTVRKVTVDPGVLVARRIATLRLAADLLENTVVVPDGIEGYTLAELDTDHTGTGVMPDVDAAIVLAGAKVARSGDRTDIGAAITEAMADVPVGTFLKVSELCRITGTGSGATAAHLFPKSGPRVTATWKGTPLTATTKAGITRI